MVEKPIVFLPFVWKFVPNVLPQPLQNLTVKLTIDGLTRGYEFLVDNALDVEKKGQHWPDIAANLTRSLWPRWIWRLPLRRLRRSLRVIPYTHVSSSVMVLEMKMGSSLACGLSSLQTETRRTFWSSLSSLGTNLAEIRLMFKLSAKMRWTVPYDSPAISQTSWIFCLRFASIASRTFAMFSGAVLVDVRPERSSSSTSVRPSLKRLYHKKMFFFGTWRHLRRLPVTFGGFLQQFF